MRVPVRWPKLTDALAAGLTRSSKWMPYGLLTVQYSKRISKGWKPNTLFSGFWHFVVEQNPGSEHTGFRSCFCWKQVSQAHKAGLETEKLMRFLLLTCVFFLYFFLFASCCLLEGTKWVEQTCFLLLLLHSAATTTTITSLRWCKLGEAAKCLFAKIKIYDQQCYFITAGTFWPRQPSSRNNAGGEGKLTCAWPRPDRKWLL